MNEIEVPLVTVVISTRNRGESIIRTLRTILLNNYPSFAVIIVDQSENDLTEKALQPFLHNPCIRYIRTDTIGASVGRNIGISKAQSEFIAITDDDCEVPTNWLRVLVTAFEIDNRIGVVFGNVLSGPHNPAKGFITSYMRNEPFLARSICEKHQVEGILGCMGLRRSVWELLGGFDQTLGLGAPLKSSEESDFTIRTLLAGYFIYETPDVTVIHHGFCPWSQGRTIIHRNWYGTGAMLVKHLKCGHWLIIYLLLHLACRWAFGSSRVATSLGTHPHKLLRLVAFIQGCVAGAFTPISKTKGHFVNQEQSKDSPE